MSWQSGFVLVDLFVLLALYHVRRIPADLLFFCGALLPGIVGILSANQLVYSIVNSATMTILALSVITHALYQRDFFRRFSQVIYFEKSSIHRFICLLSYALSGSLLMQRDLVNATVSYGSRKRMIALDFLVVVLVIAGACTVIGSVITITFRELLSLAGYAEPLNFFATGKVAFYLLGFFVLIFSFIPLVDAMKKSVTKVGLITVDSILIHRKGQSHSIIRNQQLIDKVRRFCVGDQVVLDSNSHYVHHFPYWARIEEKSKDLKRISAADLFVLTAVIIWLVFLISGFLVYWTTALCALFIVSMRLTSLKNYFKAINWDYLLYCISALLLFHAMQESGLAQICAEQFKSLYPQNNSLLLALHLIFGALFSFLFPPVVGMALLFSVSLEIFSDVTLFFPFGLALLFGALFQLVDPLSHSALFLASRFTRKAASFCVRGIVTVICLLFVYWQISRLFLND